MRARVDISTSVDVQAQTAWLLQHRDEVTRDRLPQLRAQRDSALAELAIQLPEWRWQVPEGGLSIWLELPGEDASAVCQRALRQGIRLLTGRAFDLHGRDERHLRLPFVHPAPLMREIVRHIATAAHGLGPLGQRDDLVRSAG
jgi:DNA-binding transcriptional MocR family regulator